MDFSLSDLYKQVVPVNARTFIETAMGKTTPITERDFSPEELDTLKQSVKAAKSKNSLSEEHYRKNLQTSSAEYNKKPETEWLQNLSGKYEEFVVPYSEWIKRNQSAVDSYEKTRDRTSISYGDYPIKSGETAAPVGQNWGSAIYQSYTDPGFRLASTLGSAKYHENGGKPFIEDSYGFSSDHPGVYKGITDDSSLTDILSKYIGTPGALGEILYSKYLGKGRRPVKINLP